MFVYKRLFSIVLGFSLLFTLVSCQDRRCFQYQRGKQDRKGFDRPLSIDLRHVAREKVGASACGNHTRLLETQNNKCSCPLTNSHSKKHSVVPVPSRLYKVFDELRKNSRTTVLAQNGALLVKIPLRTRRNLHKDFPKYNRTYLQGKDVEQR